MTGFLLFCAGTVVGGVGVAVVAALLVSWSLVELEKGMEPSDHDD